MQIKTTMRDYFISIRMTTIKKKTKLKITSVDKNMEKSESSYIADGNVTWYNCCKMQFGSSSKS